MSNASYGMICDKTEFSIRKSVDGNSYLCMIYKLKNHDVKDMVSFNCSNVYVKITNNDDYFSKIIFSNKFSGNNDKLILKFSDKEKCMDVFRLMFPLPKEEEITDSDMLEDYNPP